MNLAEPAIKHILSKWTEWRPLKRMLFAFFSSTLRGSILLWVIKWTFSFYKYVLYRTRQGFPE